jgi:hypothetical protein
MVMMAKKKDNEEKKTTTKNKGGRPRKAIDWEQLEKLCAIHCTGEECASVLGVSYDALNDAIKRKGYSGFPEYFKKYSGPGKASLRRMQFRAAESGNATMLIWLGKQYLGQRDYKYEPLGETEIPLDRLVERLAMLREQRIAKEKEQKDGA